MRTSKLNIDDRIRAVELALQILPKIPGKVSAQQILTNAQRIARFIETGENTDENSSE